MRAFINLSKIGFDIRDLFVVSGLFSLSYGVFLKFGDWAAFMVAGVALIAFGFLMRGK